jgi:hypothetical protein
MVSNQLFQHSHSSTALTIGDPKHHIQWMLYQVREEYACFINVVFDIRAELEFKCNAMPMLFNT